MWSIQGDGFTNLGDGHHMWTTGDLWDDRWLTLATVTESRTWFGGFTGEASVVVFDGNRVPIAKTPVQRFGVNGTAFGGSHRRDEWRYQLVDLDLTRVSRIAPVNEWHLHFELNKWIVLGQQVAPWVAAIIGI